MPTARASRRIAAPAEQLWRIVSDPYHLPRWWPRVERVEDVDAGAFTEVMRTKKGRTVRADFDLVRADEPAGTVVWEQRLAGTPFAGVLSFSETELRVVPGAEATDVTIQMRQELSSRPPTTTPDRGLVTGGASDAYWKRHLPSLGGWLLRRAAQRTIREALDGLEEISV